MHSDNKNRSIKILIIIALFVPLVVAILYFTFGTDQLNKSNISTLSITDPDGNPTSFGNGDESAKELYVDMMNTSTLVDKSVFDAAFSEEDKPYVLKYSENNLDPQNIYLYISPEIKECIYLSKNDLGENEYYRVDASITEKLLRRDEYASSNNAATLPSASIIGLDGQFELTSCSYNWKYSALDGEVKTDTVESCVAENPTVRFNTSPDKALFELSFDKQPDKIHVEIGDDSGNKFNDPIEKLALSNAFDEIYHDEYYNVTLTCDWYETESKKYSGTVVYDFKAIYDIDPTYSLLNKSLPTGEFTVLTMTDFNDGEKLYVNADNPLGLPNELNVYDLNGKKIVLVPLPHYLEEGDYSLTLTTESGYETEIVGNIKRKEAYTSQELFLSSDDEDTLALRAAMTNDALTEFNLLVTDLTSKSENEQFFTGTKFVYPTGKSTPVENGADYGMSRKVLHKDEGIINYIGFGRDLACENGQNITPSNNGKVIFAGETTLLGNTVVVDHGYSILTYYGNLDSISVNVADEVIMGETVLGKAGNTGFACALEGVQSARVTACHFAVSMTGVFVDPRSVCSGIYLS